MKALTSRPGAAQNLIEDDSLQLLFQILGLLLVNDNGSTTKYIHTRHLCLGERGYELVFGGTDNHLVLVNLKNKGIDGSRVERVLELVHIAANKNIVPGDISAMVPGGIRMGTPALTSRGFTEDDFAKVAKFFDGAAQLAIQVKSETKGGAKLKDFNATIQTSSHFQGEIASLRHDVEEYAKQFPTIGFEKTNMKYKD